MGFLKKVGSIFASGADSPDDNLVTKYSIANCNLTLDSKTLDYLKSTGNFKVDELVCPLIYFNKGNNRNYINYFAVKDAKAIDSLFFVCAEMSLRTVFIGNVANHPQLGKSFMDHLANKYYCLSEVLSDPLINRGFITMGAILPCGIELVKGDYVNSINKAEIPDTKSASIPKI